MAAHGNATLRSKKPQLSTDLKRRTESLISNKAIDGTIRKILGYALEINDPQLANFVRRVDAGESIIDEQGFLRIGE
jgi:hypothetical protein